MKNRWYILAGCTLGFSVFHANRQIMSLLLPLIKSDFGLNYSATTFLALSYDIGYLLSLILVGYLSIYIGKKEAILWGVGIITITSMLSGFFSSYHMLVLLRIIAGIGFSLYFTSGNSLIADNFNTQTKGTAYGIHNVGASLGQLYGIVIGGSVASVFAWHLSFRFFSLATMLLLIIITPLFFYYGKETPMINNSAAPNPMGFKAILGSAAFWESSLLNAAAFSGLLLITTFIPLLLTDLYGLELRQVTGLISAMLCSTIVSYLVMGVLADRIGLYPLMSLILIMAALAGLTISAAHHSLVRGLAVVLLGFFTVGSFPLSMKMLTGKSSLFGQPLAIGCFNTVGLSVALFFTWLSGKLADYTGLGSVLYVMIAIYLTAAAWTTYAHFKTRAASSFSA